MQLIGFFLLIWLINAIGHSLSFAFNSSKVLNRGMIWLQMDIINYTSFLLGIGILSNISLNMHYWSLANYHFKIQFIADYQYCCWTEKKDWHLNVKKGKKSLFHAIWIHLRTGIASFPSSKHLLALLVIGIGSYQLLFTWNFFYLPRIYYYLLILLLKSYCWLIKYQNSFNTLFQPNQHFTANH